MRTDIGVLFLSAILLLIRAEISHIHGSDEDYFLRDDDGRTRFFHGLNYVQKGFPWYPVALLNKTRCKELAANGFNAIRLGVMWSGAQPTASGFNQTYYDIIGEIVDNLAEAGMYTLFDMHQDGFSSKFCLYDGIPLWVANKSTPRKPFPWPLTGGCDRPWAENELAEASGEAYQDLYDNHNGMRDDFVAFWTETARQFKGKKVLGFELINEPFAGDVYKNPLLFLPGEAGSKNLMPLYDATIPAILAVDPERLVFYEPVTWGMIFNNTYLGSGFTHVPGGPQNAKNSVLSFHAYCWAFDIGNGAPNKLRREVCDEFFDPQVFKAIQKDIADIGGSAFLTEFGADTCDLSRGGEDECMNVVNGADSHGFSWTLWPTSDGYDGQDYNLTLYAEVLGFDRPYAVAVAGTFIHQNFTYNTSSHPYTLCYHADPSISSPTVVHWSPVFYGGKPQVTVDTSAASAVLNGTDVVITATSAVDVCVHLTTAS
eukprot:m.53458 g.53458  ORF g.53458 m.53458 type:complete len:485 (-) comp13565_c0_seq2:83-1537(-)